MNAGEKDARTSLFCFDPRAQSISPERASSISIPTARIHPLDSWTAEFSTFGRRATPKATKANTNSGRKAAAADADLQNERTRPKKGGVALVWVGGVDT